MNIAIALVLSFGLSAPSDVSVALLVVCPSNSDGSFRCRGSAPVPTPRGRGNHGGISPTHQNLCGGVLAQSAQTASLSASEESVSQIAREIAVRILSDSSAGSGIIVAGSGGTYTVLTNAHVLGEEETHTILTADAERHTASRLDSPGFGELDLALVQFTSHRPYRVVERGNSQRPEIGAPVYAAGFPNWQPIGDRTLEDTRERGFDAFVFTPGEVGMTLERSLLGGYQLGYTNDVRSGMSGGPVLDASGRLIGINGRLKYPIHGIRAFVLDDGSLPSPELFAQMEGFSWAIPIATFEGLELALQGGD